MNEPVVIVMGVSGSGKTTVGRGLAERLGVEFLEGDSFHAPANVAKMSRGEPLTDEDRWPWLAAIAAAIAERRQRGQGSVTACSALKRAYRDALRSAAGERGVFVYLKGDAALIRSRMEEREHFMRPGMLESQFEALEEPGSDEAVVVEIDKAAEEIVREIVRRLPQHRG